MTRNDQQLTQICQKLLGHNVDQRAIEMNLDEFQRLYQIMDSLAGRKLTLSVVKTLGGEVVAQFSNVAPQHFLISSPHDLNPNTFAFILDLRWHGARKKRQNFYSFLISELKLNWRTLSIVAVFSFIALFAANSLNLYNLMATLLIQSSTVFLSIYLIFTVAQSHRLADDRNLFEQGITEKYFIDDRNITYLAILTIGFVFLSSALIDIIDKFLVNQFEIAGRALKAAITSTAIVLLFDSFISVASYYLSRTMDTVERDMISDIMHDDFTENYRSNGRS